MINEEDIFYMHRAMELAVRGAGWVNPNPLVGAVIVKQGKIIAEGWHERYGGLHAERNAFAHCSQDTHGATMYVTLEPCCHFGKQPPCTDAIISHGIARVVVGLLDPNPLVAGKGIALLQAAGIEVEVGLEEEALRKQNRVFLHYITHRRPWVVMKTAMTLDGKIAAATGDSQWVTGEPARHYVHRLRSELMGIIVGIGTVTADDPLLTCRLEGEVRQPIRIIVDSLARIDTKTRLITTAHEYRTIIAHTSVADKAKLEQLHALGVETLLCEAVNGQVAVNSLLENLGKLNIDSLLLEGGGNLNYSFLEAGAINEVFSFIAPKFIGGQSAKTPIEGAGFKKMSEALSLHDITVETFGDDILIHGQVK